MTIKALCDLNQFTDAFVAITNLLDDAIQNWPEWTPEAWHRFDDNLDRHLGRLHECRHRFAALLVEHGRETPENARHYVASVLDCCVAAKEARERDLGKLPEIRDRLVHTREPILLFLALQTQEFAKLLQSSADDDTENAADKKPLTGSEREKVFQALEPAVRKAYLAFEYAETKQGGRLEDREAYDLLDEEGIDAGKGNLGQLTDCPLPPFDTWSRQLREARKALQEQKYKRRGRPRKTRSVVTGDQIENQNAVD